MTEEVDFYGVFLHGALVCAVIAALLHRGLRMVFARAGVYGWFWNPGLVDFCTFLLLWWAVVALWKPA